MTYIMEEPTIGKDGRKRVVIVHDHRREQWKSYPKLLLEQKIGRELTSDETCDHIDDDFTNDDPNNLQVLTRAQNAAKAMLLRPAEIIKFLCPVCRGSGQQWANDYRNNRRLGRSGPYCSKSCAGLVGKDLVRHETTYDYDPVTGEVTVQSESWEIA